MRQHIFFMIENRDGYVAVIDFCHSGKNNRLNY
jgi:hypothetical protein